MYKMMTVISIFVQYNRKMKLFFHLNVKHGKKARSDFIMFVLPTGTTSLSLTN